MALSNMQDYDDLIVGTTIELLAQNTDKFNAASGGTVVLNSVPYQGSFSKESFFASIASAQRRVERNAAIGSASSTALAQSEIVGVKIGGGFGPILFEPSQLTWLQKSPEEAIMAISAGFADALMADQLNTALLGGVAAIENIAALVNDVSASAGISQVALNNSHRKFGGSSQMLRADFMTGDAYHDLVNEALGNSNELFVAGNVRVVDILGKIAVVSDIPALFEAGTPNKTKILSVVSEGIVVSDNSDLITNMETTNGQTRIETTWQADYSFTLKLKGFAWDVTNGQSSPSDAEIGTGSNWDIAVGDNKLTLGTLAIADNDL